MKEALSLSIEGTSEGPKGPRKSQRAARPLTHNMSPEALLSAYRKNGQLPPQVANSRPHSDKRNVSRPMASNNSRKAQERTMDQNVQQQPGKPPVTGTNPPLQQIVPQVQYVIVLDAQGKPIESFNKKCLKAGGVGLFVLVVGQLSSAGIRRWLG